MKKKKPVLLGVCPIGKFVFSHEDALRQKHAIFEKLDAWHVNYCTIDEVITDGMIRDQKHVEPVVKYFREQGIDALFVPHCNFGTEGAVGMIAKELGVPVLLWGPRDEAPLPDGSRYRDSLCGMFASSKVIGKLHVPFTYIENCRVGDPQFQAGMSLFMRTAAVVKVMRHIKIGQIGVRVDFFWTTIDNESELLEKFGVQVLPFDMVDFLKGVKAKAQKDRSEYIRELNAIKAWLITDGLDTEEGLLNSLAMRDELFRIAEEENLDAFSIKSFTSIAEELGSGVGLGDILAQERYPIGAESDIHGAISSVLLEAASQVDEPSFFPEYTVRHPENDNAILLWHGTAPFSLRHPDMKKVEILPPWILKGLPPSSLQFRLKDGPLTVCRFDGDTGEYVLGIGQGKTVPGPRTREFYVWMEVDNWPRWERTIMEGPYIHHCSATYDHCADALEEACKYIPYLTPQRFDRERE
ncbi:MAG: fucose isomerase [bacterium]|nr:fucose isomerase [bacterium]